MTSISLGLSPPKQKKGVNPRAVKDALRRAVRFPPIFRAPQTSLVQTGRPPAPSVLDCTPPYHLGFRPPSAEKRYSRFA